MPRIEEISAVMEQLAPKELAQQWDNVGTLVNCGGEVNSILVSLDITNDVVTEAESQGCQLIVSHHPVIFHPLRRMMHGEVPYRLVKKGISAICAHTNLDAANGGVNDVLAAIFGINSPMAFAENLGRVGRLRAPATPRQLADVCTGKFSAHVRMVDCGRMVNNLAVIGGSGGSFLSDAKAAGADCLITGEAGHHDAIDAAEMGLSLIVAGHFHTEFPVVPVMADRLLKAFPSVRVLVSRRSRDPFSYLDP